MLNHIDFFQTRLEVRLDSDQTVMRVRALNGILECLNALPTGDHVYFVISYKNRQEVVRYDHTQPLTLQGSSILLPIERGQHGTVITSWAAGICVRTELTKAILDEWWREKDCNC